MNLVIDASVTVAWYFDDETTPVTEGVLDRVSETGAIVPTLWRLEVANAFQSAIRRKRITAGYRDRALAELMKMPITIDTETNAYWPSVSGSRSTIQPIWSSRSATATL